MEVNPEHAIACFSSLNALAFFLGERSPRGYGAQLNPLTEPQPHPSPVASIHFRDQHVFRTHPRAAVANLRPRVPSQCVRRRLDVN
jgi:hypothetical protein